MRFPLLLLCTTLACAGDAPGTGEDYTLRLDPIVAEGQAPFDGAVLELHVDAEDGRRRYGLGPADAPGWEAVDTPALEGARLGLLLTDPGAPTRPLDLADVRGFGLSAPLTLTEGDAVAPVWVGAFGVPGALGFLDEPVIDTVVATLPDGDPVVFGGHAVPTGDAVAPIWRIDRGDEDLLPRRVAELPEADSPVEAQLGAARVGATATPVRTEEGPAVFVFGGRKSRDALTSPFRSGFLWTDEDTDPDFVSNAPGTDVREDGRSHHQAIPSADGRVVILGGYDNANAPVLDWVVFDPKARTWSQAGTVQTAGADVGSVGPAVADLGEAGIVACGGGYTDRAAPATLALTAGCVVVQPGEAPRSLTELADGLDVDRPDRAWAAAAPAGRGRVLITGGFDRPLAPGTTVQATDTAWLLDVEARTWTTLPPMASPRAMHRAVPLPDGRVVLVGGVTAASGHPPEAAGAAVRCAEVFDPATDRIEVVSPCTDAGAGALPALGPADGHGIFVLEGDTPDGGGSAWGVIPTGPSDLAEAPAD